MKCEYCGSNLKVPFIVGNHTFCDKDCALMWFEEQKNTIIYNALIKNKKK